MHSESLTGDGIRLPSLRLRLAVEGRAQADFREGPGGLFVYLKQEGRGIGLHNQDPGV